MTGVHVIVPDGIDDPARPSGGNFYDRRVCDGLGERGWRVYEHAIAGAWPCAGETGRAALSAALSRIADGSLVLIDGLIASASPEALSPQAQRLRVVVLVHMPLGRAVDTAGTRSASAVATRERAVLSSAAAVITTSGWTRTWLIDTYGLERVHVATPGVDVAGLAQERPDGTRLICVGAVTPHKGHDVLYAALAGLDDLPWRCLCVGALTRDPEYAASLRRQCVADGFAGRFDFSGPLVGDALDGAYAGSDVLVLASRAETYGMVVTEALARGLPVIASDVGGVPEALGVAPGGDPPGRLVPPGEPVALEAALREWLTDGDLRRRLRRAAEDRRLTLTGWTSTVDRITPVLTWAAA